MKERRADVGLVTGQDGLRGDVTSRGEEAGPAVGKSRAGMENSQQNQVKEAMGFHNSGNRPSRKSREEASPEPMVSGHSQVPEQGCLHGTDLMSSPLTPWGQLLPPSSPPRTPHYSVHPPRSPHPSSPLSCDSSHSMGPSQLALFLEEVRHLDLPSRLPTHWPHPVLPSSPSDCLAPHLPAPMNLCMALSQNGLLLMYPSR